MRPLTDLNDMEKRVLGALMEKQQTTPDYYPLSVNALVAACNQSTNRDPVTDLGEMDVLNTLRVLQQDGWVERVSGARVPRWSHLSESRLGANRPRLALVTLLLLRGAQTPGELRSRSERMHPFESVEEVQERLQSLAEHDPPLVEMLPRHPGQKEPRWGLFGGASSEAASGAAALKSRVPIPPDFQTQLDALEKRLRRVEEALEIEPE